MVLGTDFISDVLLLRMRVDDPVTLRPELLSTRVALRTLAEAITIAAAQRLELEPGDLQAEHRPALSPGGGQGLEAEIYIYDTLAGGAGFAHRVGEMGASLFEEVIDLLEGCPAGCERSCYRCLRSFKNRFEHALLDRHLGASLLRHLLLDQDPRLDPRRIEQAADRLHADLSRQGIDGVEFLRGETLDVPGIGKIEAPILVHSDEHQLVVGVHGPLTPDHPDDDRLAAAKEFGPAVPVQLLDEIVISQNLPRATKSVLEMII
jgi:hypothetical protein